MEANYERDMCIDVTALDVEWTEQAELAMKYGRMWAEKKEELEKASENVKLVKAELTVDITQDPEKYLGEGIKSTVANVEAAILNNDKYKEAKDEYFVAMKEFSIIEVAKNEISFTRKSALENLVILHGQQYFAGPKMPRDLKSEVEKRKASRNMARKESNSKVKIRRRN